MAGITSSQTILIVDDSDDDFEILLRAFKKQNNLQNPIFRCENGQKALDYLFYKGNFEKADHPYPGIILLDLNMPGIDGKQVLEKIKQHEELREIPVVIFTTSNDEKDIEHCYQLGANTYIQKPVDLQRFMEAIERLKEYWFEIALLPK